MDIQDYAAEYQRKADDELLLIAARADQLVPEAIAALRAEIAHRGLSQQDLQGRLMEWREEAQANRKNASGKYMLSRVVWWFLLALMGIGVTVMKNCNAR